MISFSKDIDKHVKQIHLLIKYCTYTIFILLGMTSCQWFEIEEKPTHERTVLVYMAADNNLASFHQEDIDEMLKGAHDIPQNCRLLVYADDQNLPRILSIEQQKGRRPVARIVQQYTAEHNSGDTETLRMAMQWVIENFPAESYGLVLWSHGSAWVPAKSPAQRAICVDSKASSWMEIKDIAEVLAQLPHLEFILFDACFMQAIEVAYELREVTDYTISSPAEIPGPGAPYHRLISPMFSIPIDPESIIDEYYREYKDNKIYIQGHEPDCFGTCLSVVDCRQLDQLSTLTRKMIQKYVHKDNATNLSNIQRYYPGNSNSIPEYYDMNGYMRRLITSPDDYSYWKEAFDNAVPHKRATPQWFSDYTYKLENIIDTENYSGISCYVPQTRHTKLNGAFQATAWYHAAGWDQTGW